jgi:hypothetical protein
MKSKLFMPMSRNKLEQGLQTGLSISVGPKNNENFQDSLNSLIFNSQDALVLEFPNILCIRIQNKKIIKRIAIRNKSSKFS